MTEYAPRADYAHKLGDVRRHACTAHLPGGGPADARCIDCVSFHQTAAGKRRRRGRCVEWAELRGIGERFAHTAESGWWFGLPTISGETAACKFYEEKPSPAKGASC